MSKTIKIANVEFTNLPQAEADRYQRNVDAGIPLPLVFDEHLESNFFTTFLTEEQKSAIRTTVTLSEKRNLLHQFISEFAAE